VERSVLFVCLGNICRSPLAEAALQREAERLGLSIEIDSAGTGDWHVGCPPDPRAQAVAARSGVDIAQLRARQVTVEDFRRFGRIVALDAHNLEDLRAMAPAEGTAELSMLLDLVPGREGEAVADPYHGGDAQFDETWRDVCQGTRALAEHLAQDA